MIHYTYTTSPLGRLLVAASPDGLVEIRFPQDGADPVPATGWEPAARPAGEAVLQLQAYFAGDLQQFDLPLAPEGTGFQQQVWAALRAIPYGETCTYAALAEAVGNPRAVRAVGLANGRNPLPIVVPCHRVVGSDGTLTGYAGGLARKAALLAHERRHSRIPGRQLALL